MNSDRPGALQRCLRFFLIDHPLYTVIAACLFVFLVELFFVIGYPRYVITNIENSYYGTVECWLQHGYFRQFGLWGAQSFQAAQASGQAVDTHRSFPTGYVLPIFWIQKIVFLFRGRSFVRLYSLYASFFPIVSALLIAWMFLRQSLVLQPKSRTILATGFAVNYLMNHTSSQAYYQRVNLETTFIAALTLFAVLLFKRGEDKRSFSIWVLSGAGFLLSYISPLETFLFVASFVLLECLSYRENRSLNIKPLALFIAGALSAVVLYAGQLALAKRTYPIIYLSGSSLKWRMGLDGSTTWFRTMTDVIHGNATGLGHRYANSEWTVQFFLGIVGLTLVLPAAMRAIDRRSFTLSAYALTFFVAYLLHVALFAQMVVIHVYFFDAFVMTACYIFGLLLLPTWICENGARWMRLSGEKALQFENSVLTVFCLADVLLLGHGLRQLSLIFGS